MRTVVVRNVVIGAGTPKICVPIIGTSKDEILKEVNDLTALDFDLVEWRVDFFDQIKNWESVESIVSYLRQVLGEIPVLFTVRSKAEGGATDFSEDEYFDLIQRMVRSQSIDLVDIELFMSESKVKETVKLANSHNVKVIMSNHDFDKTPDKQEMLNRLKKMQDFGADICKIAVMPKSASDVLTLLQVTNEMDNDRPIVTISMGTLGMISRISGELFGSAMTFGASTKSSAPGQIPIKELRNTLTLLK